MSSGRSRATVVIAGAGPAGLATALYLLRARPELAGDVVALEKARHPRSKPCGGGLIPKTLLALEELGLGLEVPAVEVLRGSARTPAGEVRVERGEALCTVVRRDEFDAHLARAAVASGLRIVEQCRVTGVSERGEGVTVATTRGDFEAEVLVGADGSGSRVRRAVFGDCRETLGRALTVDVPAEAERAAEFRESLYRFDFRCVAAGVAGYAWSFPCLIDGKPCLNVGIYDQFVNRGTARASTVDLLRALAAAFPELALSEHRYKPFPVRWFDGAARLASGRVLLAGDAAGVDPLMGEGISLAFDHGKLAARAVARRLEGDDAALQGYERALRHGSVGRRLKKLASAARHFYGPRYRLYFRLAGLSRHAQAVGVDWYNGAAHLDELSMPRQVARWLGNVLFGLPVR